MQGSLRFEAGTITKHLSVLGIAIACSSSLLAAGGHVVAWGDNSFGQAGGWGNPVVALAGGPYFSLFVERDGILRGAGENFNGEASPPSDLGEVVSVKGGQWFGLALRRDGTVVGWGLPPSLPEGVSNVVSIATGLRHCLALRADGTVVAWGENGAGQCDVPPGLKQAIGIAAGDSYSLALRADGTLAAWGADTFGRLSEARTLTNVIQVAAFQGRTIVLTGSGPYTWGPGASQLASFTNVQEVACGEDHFMALQGDGTVLAWGGWNQSGQVNVPAGLGNVARIAAGAAHSLALVMDPQPPTILTPPKSAVLAQGKKAALLISAVGPVPLNYQWLMNGKEIADATNSVLVLGDPSGSTAGVYSVRVGNAHGSVTSAEATVSVQGTAPLITQAPTNLLATLRTQVQLEVFADGAEPMTYQWHLNGVRLPGETNQALVLTNFLVAQAGDYTVEVGNAFGSVTTPPARLSYRSLVGWGYNIDGQAETPLDLTNAVAVTGGGVHSLALRADSTVHAWGGWMGGATSVPIGLSNVVEVHASGEGNLVLKADGTTAGWGANLRPLDVLTNVETLHVSGGIGAAVMQDGQVRVWHRGGTTSTLLAGLVQAVSATCTLNHVLVLRADGSVVIWRWGTALDQWQVLDSGPVRGITSGYSHWILLHEGGWVTAQQDDGTSLTNLPPGLTNVVEVRADSARNLALRADGTVLEWNTDFAGEPIQTSFLESVMTLGMGNGHSLALVGQSQPPIWVRNPRSRQAPTGTGVLLRGHALGSTPLRYQWLRDGQLLPQATNEWLCLTNVTLADSGQYHLRCSNAFGEVTSAAADLLVEEMAPYFTVQPVSMVGFPGGNARFSVEAAGSMPLSYQWFFEGEPIEGATGAVLEWPGLKRSEAGRYSVRVTNVIGEVVSAESALQMVNVAAWGNNNYGQTTLPSSLTNVVAVACGAVHNLALRGDGTVVAWGDNRLRQCDVPSGLSNVIAIAAGVHTSMALTADGSVVGWGNASDGSRVVPLGLSNVVSLSSSAYNVLALRQDGTVVAWGSRNPYKSFPSTNRSPVVEVQAGEICAACWHADGSLELKADVLSSYRATIPYGMKDAVSFSSRGDTNCFVKANGNSYLWDSQNRQPTRFYTNGPIVSWALGDYHFTGLRPDGTVVCLGGRYPDDPPRAPAGLRDVVQIASGSEHSLAVIAPDGPPVLWYQPRGAVAWEEGRVALDVGAFGPGPLRYQWQLEGHDIEGANEPRLTLRSLGSEHQGNYQVRVSNPWGAVTSRAAFLRVSPVPVLRLEASLTQGEPDRRVLWAQTEADGTFILERLESLDGSASWAPVATFRVRTNLLQWVENHTPVQRYYRLQLASPVLEGEEVLAAQDMVWVAPGSFVMGSPEDEEGRWAAEGPQTRVTISRGFYLGRYEVTQAQFRDVLGYIPSSYGNSANQPVALNAYEDAWTFCKILTEHEREAGRIPSNYEYRLPTEAEWEFAARAGTTTAFYFGGTDRQDLLGDYEWFQGNSGGKVHPVGQKLPNPWGFYDMLGNVRELSSSEFYFPLPGGEVTDPVGPEGGFDRVGRGGSIEFPAASSRCANRRPVAHARNVGFRLVLSRVR